MLRFGIPALMNMTGFCASNEYKLLSGDTAREVALVILFATIIAELLLFITTFHKEIWLKKSIIDKSVFLY
jgi:hypothetical protein